MIVRAAAVAVSLIAGILIGAPASAAEVCTAPTLSTTQPGYLVADPDCDLNGTPFTALPGARTYTGIRDGAAYRIEVPQNWNGRLALYAHGYRGTGTTVYVGSPELRAHWIAKGFAWAASSYATNGYDVGQGVRDSYALIGLVKEVTGRKAVRARCEALAYAAGAIAICLALGAMLLTLRAAGVAAGWAFQLQDPRIILVLLLLVTAIALNLAGLFRLPTIGGPVEHAQGHGDGEPHQLVAATAHPPEALGQQAASSLRPGGGRGASGRRSSEVGEIA